MMVSVALRDAKADLPIKQNMGVICWTAHRTKPPFCGLGTDIRYKNYTMKYGIMVYTGIIPWRRNAS